MQNPNASNVPLVMSALVRLIAVVLCIAVAQIAFADSKQECSAAYDQTQALRKAGRLDEAHRQAALCTRDACAAFIRTDCAKWLGEIEASQPTVVIQVKDAQGRDAFAVGIALDGRPWLDRLDGTAKTIDPGQHSIRYSMPGSAPIDDTVLIREGEKNRQIGASFQKGTASGGGSGGGNAHSVGPWIVGAVGVGVLVGGAVTGALVLHDKSVTDTQCHAAVGTAMAYCTSSGESAASQGRVLGPVTTVELAVGGVALAGGIAWLAVDLSGRKQTTGSFIVTPVVGKDVGGVAMAGAF